MRVCCIADLHGFLPAVPECDLLVVAGDVTPATDHTPDVQERWLAEELRPWLAAIDAPVVGIAGNHDLLFEDAPQRVPGDLAWTYLQDAGATVGGLSFWGSPWTPWFHDWAFNAPREDGEAFLAQRYAAVPDDTDVLVVHGPPRGYGDRTSTGFDAGSTAFLELVDRVRPRLAVFGHIHEAAGTWTRGDTVLVNASAVDLRYALRPEPFVIFDL